MADSIREQLKKEYQRILETGVNITLKGLAERSVEIVGKPISYETVRVWASQDNWNFFIASSLDKSPVLRDTKNLFYKAKDDLEASPGDWAAFRDAAQSMISLAKSIPGAYRILVEQDISDAYELVNRHLIDNWYDMKTSHRKNLVSARGILFSMMDAVNLQVEEGGVSPDEVLLSER